MAALSTQRFSGDNVTQTPITAPINCDHFYIINDSGDDVYFRTNSGDANTQITVPNTIQFTVTAPKGDNYPGDKLQRFASGDTIGYFKFKTQASGSIAVTGIR